MHDFFSGQRPPAHPTRNNSAGALGEGSFPQPAQAALARSLSIASSCDSHRMGRGGESTAASGQRGVHDVEPRIPATFSPSISTQARAERVSIMRTMALGLIRFYQGCLSPTLPSACRFFPSCSAYAYEAVEKWGVRKGVWMALQRLIRCRPWGGRGYDPVP